MSIHTRTSVPPMSGRPRGHSGRNALMAAVAGGILVVAIAAGATWWRAGGERSTSPALEPGRAPAAAAESAAAPSRSHFTPHTIYIVSSEQRADFVRGGINDSNAILADLGLPPVLDEVLVAETPERAAAIVAGIRESNEVLFDLYHVDNRMVDLRR